MAPAPKRQPAAGHRVLSSVDSGLSNLGENTFIANNRYLSGPMNAPLFQSIGTGLAAPRVPRSATGHAPLASSPEERRKMERSPISSAPTRIRSRTPNTPNTPDFDKTFLFPPLPNAHLVPTSSSNSRSQPTRPLTHISLANSEIFPIPPLTSTPGETTPVEEDFDDDKSEAWITCVSDMDNDDLIVSEEQELEYELLLNSHEVEVKTGGMGHFEHWGSNAKGSRAADEKGEARRRTDSTASVCSISTLAQRNMSIKVPRSPPPHSNFLVVPSMKQSRRRSLSMGTLDAINTSLTRGTGNIVAVVDSDEDTGTSNHNQSIASAYSHASWKSSRKTSTVQPWRTESRPPLPRRTQLPQVPRSPKMEEDIHFAVSSRKESVHTSVHGQSPTPFDDVPPAVPRNKRKGTADQYGSRRITPGSNWIPINQVQNSPPAGSRELYLDGARTVVSKHSREGSGSGSSTACEHGVKTDKVTDGM
jgi:hypothetical protein